MKSGVTSEPDMVLRSHQHRDKTQRCNPPIPDTQPPRFAFFFDLAAAHAASSASLLAFSAANLLAISSLARCFRSSGVDMATTC